MLPLDAIKFAFRRPRDGLTTFVPSVRRISTLRGPFDPCYRDTEGHE